MSKFACLLVSLMAILLVSHLPKASAGGANCAACAVREKSIVHFINPFEFRNFTFPIVFIFYSFIYANMYLFSWWLASSSALLSKRKSRSLSQFSTFVRISR